MLAKTDRVQFRDELIRRRIGVIRSPERLTVVRVGATGKALLLAIVHDGDAVRHPVEDHGVPETLGINRQVVPAGQILVFKKITESAGILQAQGVNAIAKDSARDLHTLNFCFD